MVVEKEFILAKYCDARTTLEHEQAIDQVAALCGQTAEIVAQVLQEEATA